MALTPEEIVSYDLKQAVRGYSIAQVDDLLDQLADQVEAAQLERDRLAGRLRDAEERLEASRSTESTLQRTLVTAQQAAERSLQEARDEADALLEQARGQARSIEQEADRERTRLVDEAREIAASEAEEARLRRAALLERLDELRERERRHRARLRDLLERELEELDRFEATEVEPSGGDTAATLDEAGDDTEENFFGLHTVPPPAGRADPEESGDTDESVVEQDDDVPEAGPETDVSQPGDRHGLRVKVHGRVDDPGSDSPLGSPPVRDED